MIMSFTPGDHIFKSYILTLTNPKILLTTFSCSQRETIFFGQNEQCRCSDITTGFRRLKLRGSWFHLSFEHFMASFLWSIRVYAKIVVDLLSFKRNKIIRIYTNDIDFTSCGRRVKTTCLIFVLGILC